MKGGKVEGASGEDAAALKAFLDAHLDDFSTLDKTPQLVEELTVKTRGLQDRLDNLERERPALSRSALAEASEALEAINSADEKREAISIALDRHMSSVRHQRLRNNLSSLSKQISEIQLAENYLELVLHIGQLSRNIKEALVESSESDASVKGKEAAKPDTAGKGKKESQDKKESWSHENYKKAVDNFLQLRNIQQLLKPKTCANLKAFVSAAVEKAGDYLESKLIEKYEGLFGVIYWPTLPSVVTQLNPPTADPKDLHVFRVLFSLLLLLQVSREDTDTKGKQEETVTLLPIQLLLEPLIKRFQFHFMSAKKTNRLDKPEWFFMDTRDAIRLNTEFLAQHVQPLLDNEAISFYYRFHDAKAEFIAGLVEAISAKLTNDMNAILGDDSILLHTVNEALEFHKAVCEVHGYPPHFPSCLNVFTNDKLVFEAWIDVESKFAMEHFGEIMEDKSHPWELLYTEFEDAERVEDEEVAPSRSAEALISLLSNITERYKLLPKALHRLRFLKKVQCRLLRRYLDAMKGMFNSEKTRIAQHRFHVGAMLLNSLCYCQSILKDWGEQLFFLELQNVKQNKEEADQASLLEVTGSVFDPVLLRYRKLKIDITQSIVHSVAATFKEHTAIYLNTRKIWGHVGTTADIQGDEEMAVDLSTDICEALAVLKRNLNALKGELTPKLFEKMWKKIATQIDSYIFTQLKSGTQHFVGKGGFQFKRDMMALFLIFREFTTKPDLLFREVKEAMTVLTMDKDQLAELRALVVGDIPSDERILKELDWKDKLRLNLKSSRPATTITTQTTDKSSEPYAKFGLYRLRTKQLQTILSLRVS